VNIYSAYGLTIHSALPLPELITLAEGKPDVIIRLAKIDSAYLTNLNREDRFYFADKEALVHWEQIGTFLVRDGSEIVIDLKPGIDENLVRLPLLGSVLAVLLHQRGYLVLHASAISIQGDGVAFIGEKGRGKSTIAAALYARGHTLIGDDIVALDVNEQGLPFLLPGFPQFKLWPAAAASSLGDNPELLPRLVCGEDKRARRIYDRFSNGIAPLRGIFTLSWGDKPAIKALQSTDAILQLLTQSYMARFGKQCLTGEAAARHLKQCADLISKVPVFRLERPSSLNLLAETAQLVEEQTLALYPSDDDLTIRQADPSCLAGLQP
jgi:hypothetical protein